MVRRIHRLDIGIGKLLKLRILKRRVRATTKREEWFAEGDEVAATAKGLKPNANRTRHEHSRQSKENRECESA
jgi:hypothetical protein